MAGRMSLPDSNPSSTPLALADTIREALWQGSDEAKLGEAALDQLLALLAAHHTVGALDKTLIGERCPVCQELCQEPASSQQT
jgi:hypothetical protein